jgi:hypothetical protein
MYLVNVTTQLDEVKKVFVSDGWYSEIATNKLKVDSKPIDGPLSVYKAPIQRVRFGLR